MEKYLPLPQSVETKKDQQTGKIFAQNAAALKRTSYAESNAASHRESSRPKPPNRKQTTFPRSSEARVCGLESEEAAEGAAVVAGAFRFLPHFSFAISGR